MCDRDRDGLCVRGVMHAWPSRIRAPQCSHPHPVLVGMPGEFKHTFCTQSSVVVCTRRARLSGRLPGVHPFRLSVVASRRRAALVADLQGRRVKGSEDSGAGGVALSAIAWNPPLLSRAPQPPPASAPLPHASTIPALPTVRIARGRRQEGVQTHPMPPWVGLSRAGAPSLPSPPPLVPNYTPPGVSSCMHAGTQRACLTHLHGRTARRAAPRHQGPPACSAHQGMVGVVLS
jgi:hypothetical protein